MDDDELDETAAAAAVEKKDCWAAASEGRLRRARRFKDDMVRLIW